MTEQEINGLIILGGLVAAVVIFALVMNALQIRRETKAFDKKHREMRTKIMRRTAKN
jgi:hypothetical protein